MNVNHERYLRRCHEFDGPILDIARDVACVDAVIKAYAYGKIITKEEALSQMVVQLSANWGDVSQRYYKMMEQGNITITK